MQSADHLTRSRSMANQHDSPPQRHGDQCQRDIARRIAAMLEAPQQIDNYDA